MLQVTVGVAERLGEPCNKALGRIVGDEMVGKLVSYVARRCRVTRQVYQCRLALFDTAGRICLAKQYLRARLVSVGKEHEGAWLTEPALASGKHPARDDAGEHGDVGLRVATADTQRMQFEYFARQVLVEPTLTPLPCFGVRPERLGVVEVEQHGGMLLDREQHVGETPEHVWPDRLALEAACAGAHNGPLQGGYAKMVRPEIHEPLGKTGLGLRNAFEARHGVGTKQLLSDRLFDRFWRIVLSHRVATSNRAHHVWRAGLRRGGFRRRTAFDLLLLLLSIDRL